MPESLSREETKAQEMLNDMEIIRLKYLPNGSPWLYGTTTATALDTHLMIFLCRLMDVGREHLIPDTMRSYSKNIMDSTLWIGFMQGRSTMYSY